MRIIYVTSSTPYGPGEAFIIPEIEEVRRQGHAIFAAPWGLHVSFSSLILRTFCRHAL